MKNKKFIISLVIISFLAGLSVGVFVLVPKFIFLNWINAIIFAAILGIITLIGKFIFEFSYKRKKEKENLQEELYKEAIFNIWPNKIVVGNAADQKKVDDENRTSCLIRTFMLLFIRADDSVCLSAGEAIRKFNEDKTKWMDETPNAKFIIKMILAMRKSFIHNTKIKEEDLYF